MTTQTMPSTGITADASAYAGAGFALVAFALTVFRIIVQTRVSGGYEMFAGPLGSSWWAFFIAAMALSVVSFIGTIALIRKDA